MALTVFNGTTHDVDDTTEIGDLVLSGGTLDVASLDSGGTIEDTTVSGTDNIYSGGRAISSLVTGVWSSGGTGSVFINGGDENVLSGGTADGTSVTGVSSGGSSFFGVQEVFGIASGTMVLDLGLQIVNSGGSALNATVSSGGNEYVRSDGHTTGAIVDGGVQVVESAGLASATRVDGGHLVVGPGGSAYDATVDGGDALIEGFGSSATINSGGLEVIEPGAYSLGGFWGSSWGDTLNGGIQIVFGGASAYYGEATSTTVNGGGTQVVWSASVSGTTVNSGSFEFVVSGGSALDSTINSGGTEYVEWLGSTYQDSIFGTEIVSSAYVEFTSVGSGGQLVVDNAGSASATEVYQGGTIFVESGGSASFTQVSGGVEYLYGGSSFHDSIFSGGSQFIASGGVASVTVAYGTEVVGSGGYAWSAVVADDGGTQIVSSGGELYAASVLRDALEQVLSGGTALSTQIYSGGEMEIESGGSVGGSSGTVYFAAYDGTLKLDDSVNFLGRIAGFDAYAGSGSALAATNYLDLQDILYGPSTNVSFTEANGGSSGTLMVTDGTHTANLVLLGDYSTGDFQKKSDGFGGTEIYDPANSAQLSIQGSVVAQHT
jgi:autotransporter passenger strand-loop-strand repeat protein